MVERVLTIDPSIRACGWAVFELWSSDKPFSNSIIGVRHKDSGVLKLRKDKDDEDPLEWVQRCDEVCGFMAELESTWNFARTLIEMPSTYSGGKGDVAGNSGAVMKLAFLVASIRSYMGGGITGEGVPTTLIPVRTWKGTLPKEIIQKRVRRYWNVDKEDHNEMDAIGLGDYYFRRKLKLGDKIRPSID